MKLCIICGAIYKEEKKYCEYCGSKLNDIINMSIGDGKFYGKYEESGMNESRKE